MSEERKRAYRGICIVSSPENSKWLLLELGFFSACFLCLRSTEGQKGRGLFGARLRPGPLSGCLGFADWSGVLREPGRKGKQEEAERNARQQWIAAQRLSLTCLGRPGFKRRCWPPSSTQQTDTHEVHRKTINRILSVGCHDVTL